MTRPYWHVLAIAAGTSACAGAGTSGEANPDPIYELEAVQQRPRLLSCIGYFEPPADQRYTSDVALSFVIGVQGRVEPRTVRIRGAGGGRAEEAVALAKDCVWTPAIRDGHAVRVRASQEFRFDGFTPDPVRHPEPPPPPPPPPTPPDTLQVD